MNRMRETCAPPRSSWLTSFGLIVWLVLVSLAARVTNVAARPAEPAARLVAAAPSEPAIGIPGSVRSVPGAVERAAARSDTVDFGFYEIRPDGKAYAVQGGRWTFDHGAPDPWEGWTADDATENDRDFWRHMDASTWLAEGNPPPWPQMIGAGMALCGAGQNLADTLGWAAGIGYGNEWCQRLVSPELTYSGSGSVQLSFLYFNETEEDYDYSKIFVQVGTNRTPINTPGFTGIIGVGPTGVITPQGWTHAITNGELGGGGQSRPFRIVLEFDSDGYLSDDDGESNWDARYGAIGVDDVALDGANLVPPVSRSYAFETDLEGWTAERCPGVGSYFGVAPLSLYGLPDYCECNMAGNVMEFHDDNLGHPDDQHETAVSPIFDRQDLGPGYLDYNLILAEAQIAGPLGSSGMVYRFGWSYYPYEDPDVPASSAGRLASGLPCFSGEAPAAPRSIPSEPAPRASRPMPGWSVSSSRSRRSASGRLPHVPSAPDRSSTTCGSGFPGSRTRRP